MKNNYNFSSLVQRYGASILLFIFCFLFNTVAMAQCPDFLDLYSPNVTAYYGKGVDERGNPFENEGLIPGRHTLMTTPGYDPRTGNKLSVLPPGGGPSIKLGNEDVLFEAEALVYKYYVDVNNALLLLNFAVVLEDPGHSFYAQPRFIVRVIGSDGELVEACAEYDVTSGSDIPGFEPYQYNLNRMVMWRDWTLMSIDLSLFVGQEVQVQFITYDCGYGAHFGYAYFTASCMANTMEATACEGGTFTLEAPPNFDSYLWSNGTTQRTATFITSEVTNSHITCTATSAMDCEVTFFAYITTENVVSGTFTDVLCEGENYTQHHFNLPPQQPGQWFFQNVIVNPFLCSTEVINLNLTVIKRFNKINAAICFGESYIENGFNIIEPQPGLYRDTIITGYFGDCSLLNILELVVSWSFNMPDLIQGEASPCTKELCTYSFIGAESLTAFYWVLPDNAIQMSSNFKPQITLFFIDDTPSVITLYGQNGCGNSTASFEIHPRQSYLIQLNEQICQGEVFDRHGFNLGVQNNVGTFVYSKDLNSSLGCDSIVNILVNVLPAPMVKIVPKDTVLCTTGDEVTLVALLNDMTYDPVEPCNNDSDPALFIYYCGVTYLWNTGSTEGSINVNPSVTTNYSVTIATDDGCSASASEFVIVDQTAPIVLYDTICKGEIYTKYDITAIETGFYQTTINNGGCTVNIGIYLTVVEPAVFIISGDICAGEEYTGYGLQFTLYEPGIFRDTLYVISSTNCDSLVIINFNVLPAKTTQIYDNICQFLPYSANGFNLGIQYFTGVQTYSKQENTAQGCDSTTILKLFVHPTPVNIVNFGADTVCVGTATTFTNWSIDGEVPENELSWKWYLEGTPTPFAITKNASEIITLGAHNVTLQVQSTYGCNAETTSEVWVYETPLVADITGNTTPDISSTETYTFVPQSDIIVTKFEWIVTDGIIVGGGEITDDYVTVYWTTKGENEVALVVSNPGCSAPDTARLEIFINVSAITYTITPSAGANGSIFPDTIQTINEGGSTTFTFSPATNYEIFQVLIDEVNNPTAVAAGSYTFANVQTNHTIHVTFTPISVNNHTIYLTIGNNGGGNSHDENFAPGSYEIVVKDSADWWVLLWPDHCYDVNELLVNGEPFSSFNYNVGTTFYNITEDLYISISFVLRNYSITVTQTPNGAITPATGNVGCATTPTYTFTPDTCYEIDQVWIDGTPNSAAAVAGFYQFDTIKANHTVTATFKIKTYTITATANENGTINLNGIISVICGSSCTFTFTPDDCYEIDKVLINGTNNSGAVAEKSYTFNNVIANHTIVVSFKLLMITNCPDEVYDEVNNHTYTVVPLAGRCWFRENFRGTKYQDDTDIPLAVPYYNAQHPNTEQNTENFGLLYTWHLATNDESGPSTYIQGLCPQGWRIPTAAEWQLLAVYDANKLKNPDFWLIPNDNNNQLKFDSRGAGFYNSENNRFEDLYGFTAYWSSDTPDNSSATAFSTSIYYHCNQIEIVQIKKTDAISVRCIME
ncbi:MAG: fibrobacter succinogenes major paralogous domain-containing protein [Bacteroidales bacterium]|jgi:uncharacterized protein (TIGR02145 family)|nr:fibrobacter succinogenes major paralogous domain-containing protein [Bacteroidales bacterium]